MLGIEHCTRTDIVAFPRYFVAMYLALLPEELVDGFRRLRLCSEKLGAQLNVADR